MASSTFGHLVSVSHLRLSSNPSVLTLPHMLVQHTIATVSVGVLATVHACILLYIASINIRTIVAFASSWCEKPSDNKGRHSLSA